MKRKPVIYCNRPYHFCCTTAFSVMSMSGFLMVHWQLRDWKTALAGEREREEKRVSECLRVLYTELNKRINWKQNFPLQSARGNFLGGLLFTHSSLNQLHWLSKIQVRVTCDMQHMSSFYWAIILKCSKEWPRRPLTVNRVGPLTVNRVGPPTCPLSSWFPGAQEFSEV